MAEEAEATALQSEKDSAARLLSAVGKGRGELLDLGCRDGRLTPVLAANFEHVLGVDLTMEVLRVSVKRAENLANTDFALIAGDGLQMIKDESFEAVFSRDVFIHISGPATECYWTEVYRVLRPGGTLVFNLLGNWPSIAGGAYWAIRLKPRYAFVRLLGLELPEDWTHQDISSWAYEQERLPIGRPYTEAELLRKMKRVGYVALKTERVDASIWVVARKPGAPSQESHSKA